jgi:hypothetical protein
MSSTVTNSTTGHGWAIRWKRPLKWAGVIFVIYLVVLIPMRIIAGRAVPAIEFLPGAADTDTLVVLVHGLNGAPARGAHSGAVREEAAR